jgi:hypothetical protein
MMSDAQKWMAAAQRLGIDVVAPFDVELAGVEARFTALLPQFGAPAGMIVDGDWEILKKYKSDLLAKGYGYSCVEPPDPNANINEMLSDWGWTDASPKPDWLND